jgi:hypothetical protein
VSKKLLCHYRQKVTVLVDPVATESSARVGINVSALRAPLFVSQPTRRDILR